MSSVLNVTWWRPSPRFSAERLEQLHLAAVREPDLKPAPAVRVAAHQVLAAERVAV
jgi:hypothetical protein